MLPASLSWLDAKFMTKVLKISENDESIEVKELSINFATATGNHYLSDIIRACVKYSCKDSEDRGETAKKSLIIKVAPTSEGERKQMISKAGVFDLEIKAMRTTLEAMNELLNEENYRLNARVLYTESGDPPTIILEDLASLGYRLADRPVDLDLDHCILVMRGLAKFHASSVALCEKDPRVKEYTNGIFRTKIHEELTEFFTNGLQLFASELREWPELGSKACIFSEKFLKLSNVFFEIGIERYTPKADEFNVLNHGDCWGTNMLFRYNDSGKVTDHIFVDFQMCCWTTSLMDILLFTNSSISENVELYHYDDLLEEYLECLTRTMSRLGCKTSPPNKSIFKNIRPEHEILAIIASCVGLPQAMNVPSNTKTIDEICRGVDIDMSPYKKPEYRRRLIRRLHAWNACGVFDL